MSDDKRRYIRKLTPEEVRKADMVRAARLAMFEQMKRDALEG